MVGQIWTNIVVVYPTGALIEQLWGKVENENCSPLLAFAFVYVV